MRAIEDFTRDMRQIMQWVGYVGFGIAIALLYYLVKYC
jgi:hypothetical protein